MVTRRRDNHCVRISSMPDPLDEGMQGIYYHVSFYGVIREVNMVFRLVKITMHHMRITYYYNLVLILASYLVFYLLYTLLSLWSYIQNDVTHKKIRQATIL